MATFGLVPRGGSSRLARGKGLWRTGLTWRLLGHLAGVLLCLSAGDAGAQVSDGITSVAITAAPDAVAPGRLVQYLVSVSNRGNATRYYSISAQVPAGTTVASASLSSVAGAYVPGCGATTCTAGATLVWGTTGNGLIGIGPGQAATVSFAARVDSVSPPADGTVLHASVSVSGRLASGAVDTTTSTAADVVVSSADPTLGMSVSATMVAPGGALSYTLSFGNPGGTASTAAVLTVPLPAGTSFIAASDGGSLAGGVVTWNVAALHGGAAGQRTLVLGVDPSLVDGSVLAASATLSDAGTGRSLARGSAPAVVLAGSETLLAISSAPDATAPGQTIQYAVTVTNRGSTTRGYSISAQVPVGTTVDSASLSSVPGAYVYGCGTPTCEAGTVLIWGTPGNGLVGVSPGQSATISFSARVNSTNPLPNGSVIRATATANGYTVGTPLYSGAGATVDTVVSTSDLTLGLVNASSPVAPGGTLSYTLSFGNPGAISSPAAVLRMPLPPGTSFVSASDGGSVSAGIVSWNVAALPAGGAGQRTLAVTVSPQASSGSIVAASANLSDASTGRSLARGNAAAAVLGGSETQLAITSATDAVAPGRVVQYAVTLTNRGSTTRGYSISAQVPAGTTVDSASLSSVPGAYVYGCGTPTCVAGTVLIWGTPGNGLVGVSPGQSATVSFSARVNSTNPLPNGSVIRATATANGYTVGTPLYSGAGATVDTVVSTSDLTLGLVNASSPVAPGGTLSYTLSFGNPGAISSPAAVLRMPLPPGTSFVSASDGGSVSAGIVSWNVASLPAGGWGQRSVTLAVGAQVSSGSIIAATANLADAVTGRSLARGTAAAAVLAGSETQLTIGRTPGSAAPGQSLQYSVTVSNHGTATRSYSITAHVPSGTTVASASMSPSPGAYVLGCGASTCPAGAALVWGTPGNGLVSVAAGQSATVSFTALVDSTNPPPNGSVLRATAGANGYTGGTPLYSGAGASVDGVVQGGPNNGEPVLSTSVSSLSFGNVAVNTTSSAKVVVVTNVGARNLALGNIVRAGINPGQFNITVSSCSGAVLVPNGSCSFAVTFNPTTTGTKTALIGIPSNDPNGPASVNLSGTAVATPMVLSRTSLSFGAVAVGTSSPVQTVMLVNVGTGSLVLGPLKRDGTNPLQFVVAADGCSGATLPPGGNCSFQVLFKPSGNGAKNAFISIPSNSLTEATIVGLSGTGGTPSLVLSRSSLNFGSVVVGTTSPPQSVLLSNPGTADLVLDSFKVASTNPKEYDIRSNTCASAIVPPGTSCTMLVKFVPIDVAGARIGSISVGSNAGPLAATITLAGTALAAPTLTVSPADWDFGSLWLQLKTRIKSFDLSNPGPGPAALGSLVLGGTNPGQFEIVSDNCSNKTLASKGKCTLSIAFKPLAAGARRAIASISANGTTVAVPLAGLGTTDEVTLSGNKLDFGSALAEPGDQSKALGQSKAVTLSNGGNTNLTISSLTIDATQPADQFVAMVGTCRRLNPKPPPTFLPVVLAPGDSCSFGVSFKPTDGGNFSSRAVVVSSSASSPHTVQLYGSGLAKPPSPLSATEVLFGSASVVASSAEQCVAQTLTLSNAGTSKMALGTLGIGGANPKQFVVTANSCDRTELSAGGSCKFAICFVPTSTGPKVAKVSINDLTTGSTYSATLAGTGATRIPFLSFPLAGLTSSKLGGRSSTPVKINSVMDHHVKTDSKAKLNEVDFLLPHFYVSDTDGQITAYTGEEGYRNCQQAATTSDSTPCVSNDGTQSFAHLAASDALSPFVVNGNYSGGGTPHYLSYNGHAGYDFRASMKTPVLAPADGFVYIPQDDAITRENGPVAAVSKFNVLALDHGNGYVSWFMHMGDDSIAGDKGDFRRIRCPGDTVETLIRPGQVLPVTRGCQIGYSGDRGVPGAPHLHYELRWGVLLDSATQVRRCIRPLCIPVDPYGWNPIPGIATTVKDPYSAHPNGNSLWIQ